MGIFQKLITKFKRRRNTIDSLQGHRLIYYGDVPTITGSEEIVLKDVGLTTTATAGSPNEVIIGSEIIESRDESKEERETPKFIADEDGSDGAAGAANLTRRSTRVRQVPSFQRNKFGRKRNREFADNVVKSSRYTCLNFLPKNLFEQFRRAANFYFLVMAIIQSSIRSPVHPFTAAVPLLFVIITTAVKQGYEDWLRHKADDNVNNRPVCVVRDQQIVVVKSKDVQVGDILRLEGEDQVPADILIVGSSDEFLRCQITTANLDGETNLKMRYCPAGLIHLKHERDFGKLHVILECEQPNPSLYEFNGCLLVPPHRASISRLSESANSFVYKDSIPSRVQNGSFSGSQKGKTTSRSPPTTSKEGYFSKSPKAGLSNTLPKNGSVSQPTKVRTSASKNTSKTGLLGSPRFKASSLKKPTKKPSFSTSPRFQSSSYNASSNRSSLREATGFFSRSPTVQIASVNNAKKNANEFTDSSKRLQEGSVNNANSGRAFSAGSAGASSRKSKSFGESTISNFFTVPLTMENMVLRGARVKNTEFIFGMVVYTGKDTRLAQNSKQTNLKYSTVDITENRYLIVFISVLVVMLSVSNGFFYWHENSDRISKAYYLRPTPFSTKSTVGIIRESVEVLASFLILFNYIIPISLYVTVELQKFFGSKFFVWDKEMTCPISGHPPLCNTSDINDELGQIEYLFTDKTGTLTENIMQFRYCSVGGVNYDFMDNCLYLHEPKVPGAEQQPKVQADITRNPDIGHFLRVLALCHSVQLMPIRRPSFESAEPPNVSILPHRSSTPVKTSKMRAASSLFGLGGNPEPAIGILGKWEYQASSPDEKALLESCYRLDVKYLGEREELLTLDVFGFVETYRRHFVLEFDADRKCMSVIVENRDGEIWLYCKGAESSVIPRCASGPTQEVLKSVVDFAMMGMRTLAVAERKLTRDEFKKFSYQLKSARRLLKGRDEAMRELYRSVEDNLTCVGATGVEDQLQQGVPEMLQSLNAAGIRIWMLTGDKIETGVSVGVACGLITLSSKQYFFTNGTDNEAVQQQLEQMKADVTPDDNTTLIIDGSTLEIAFLTCPELFRDVALTVYRVICCRMAPLQKAQIVNMVKTSTHSPITAAVGDGANDVAMIQEAHIGIGILGKEGRQAARCADFALARSAFVKKAVLVHGHWFYVRLAILVIYFFYKNIVFIGPQFIYCFYSSFSTQALYDGWSLMMYNIFYTSCPVFAYGLQEQPYPADVLMKNPFLYKTISRNSLLTWSEFIKWNLFATWHSLVCFYVPYFSWSFFEPITDWSSFGSLCYCCVVGVVNTKIALETKFVSFWTVFSYCFSYGSMFLICSVYSEGNLDYYLHPSFLPPGEYRHVYFTLLSKLPFWLVVIASQLIAFAPDLVYKAYANSSFKFQKFYRRFPQDQKVPRDETVLEIDNIASTETVYKETLMRRVSTTLAGSDTGRRDSPASVWRFLVFLTKLGKGLGKNRHLPMRLSMLFTKRTGKLAVSTATLQSYLSRQDLT